MKKFTKISLFIAAILGIAGILLGSISAVMGAGYGTIRRMARNGELNRGNWHLDEYGIYYMDDHDYDSGDTHFYRDENVDIEAEISYQYEIADVKNLDMDLSAAEVHFIEGTRDDVIVVRIYDGREKYYSGVIVGGNTLKIDYDRVENLHYRTPKTEIVIEIPAGMQIGKMDVDVSMATTEFALADVSCENFVLDVDVADVVIEELQVTRLMDVGVDAGNVEINGGTYHDITVECNLGSLTMSGDLDGNLVANTEMGSIDLHLKGDAEAYNYNLDCGMGELNLNGSSYSDIHGKHNIKNEGATGVVNLNTEMGSINVVIE